MSLIQLIYPYRFALHLLFVPLLVLAVEYGGLFILGVPLFGYLLIPFTDLLLKKFKSYDLVTDAKENSSFTSQFTVLIKEKGIAHDRFIIFSPDKQF